MLVELQRSMPSPRSWFLLVKSSVLIWKHWPGQSLGACLSESRHPYLGTDYWEGGLCFTSGQRDHGPDNPAPKKVVGSLGLCGERGCTCDGRSCDSLFPLKIVDLHLISCPTARSLSEKRVACFDSHIRNLKFRDVSKQPEDMYVSNYQRSFLLEIFSAKPTHQIIMMFFFP